MTSKHVPFKRMDARKQQLGWIHKAKADLKMCDEDYRAMLWTQARVKSAADLDAGGRAKVLTYLASLVSKSFVRRAKKPELPPTERMVWALWYKLEAIGRVNKPANTQDRATALRSFVKRMTGVDDLSFCTISQTMNLIESMKAWIDRPDHLKDTGSEHRK